MMSSKKEILEKVAFVGLGASFIYGTLAAYQNFQPDQHSTSFSNELFNQIMNAAFTSFVGTAGTLVTASTFLEFLKNYDKSIAEKVNGVTEWLKRKTETMSEKNNTTPQFKAQAPNAMAQSTETNIAHHEVYSRYGIKI